MRRTTNRGNFGIRDKVNSNLRIMDKDLASKQLVKPLGPGIHTMRVMATKTTMKCYIDNERVANVPATEGLLPVSFGLYVDPWRDEENNPMLFGNLRYAEGGKTLKEQLDEAGKIVTHGILFDSGLAKIKAESHKTLADIGGLLTDSPALRLSIEGHTDNDGADAANLTLSQERADAVKTYLADSLQDRRGPARDQGPGRRNADRHERHARGEGEQPPRGAGEALERPGFALEASLRAARSGASGRIVGSSGCARRASRGCSRSV